MSYKCFVFSIFQPLLGGLVVVSEEATSGALLGVEGHLPALVPMC